MWSCWWSVTSVAAAERSMRNSPSCGPLKKLMTLKGATKHICGGKRGNSSSCLSRIPCRWGSHASPNTNLASLPTVEMILLGFQHLTVCFGRYPSVQNKDILTGTGESWCYQRSLTCLFRDSVADDPLESDDDERTVWEETYRKL